MSRFTREKQIIFTGKKSFRKMPRFTRKKQIIFLGKILSEKYLDSPESAMVSYTERQKVSHFMKYMRFYRFNWLYKFSNVV